MSKVFSSYPASNIKHPASKNVAFLIWSLGIGGAEQVVIRLAKGIDRSRFRPLVICMNHPGVFADQVMNEGIEVIALNKRGPIDPVMFYRLIKVLKNQKIDILHAHLWGAGFWGRIAASIAKVPVVLMHEHGMQPWRGRFHFFCDSLLARSTNRILFASEQVMRFYQERAKVGSKICQVITNGVSVELSSFNREEFRYHQGWKPDNQVLLSVGRLSPEKGYEDLLKAFIKVSSNLPNARLVLVGDGGQRDELQSLQKSSGLNGKVILAGRQNNVAEWLNAADLYIQPSRREGLPLAVLEAMSAGLPVVATRVGDLPKLLSADKNGFLVEPNDPELLADGMIRVLQKPSEQLRMVAKAGKDLIHKRYSFDQMIKDVEKVYEKELSKS